MSTLIPEAPSCDHTIIHSAWKEGDKPRFSALDRCDRCGAQAYIEAKINTGTLLFCSHDFNVARPAMEAQQILVSWYSETGRLVENRKQGSEN